MQEIFAYLKDVLGICYIPNSNALPYTESVPENLTLSDLEESVLLCQKCKLSSDRKNVVFGTGNPNAKLMFIGEGPGEQEDLQGEPFVGPAGQLLTKMIKAMGFDRKDVYITNIIKCRPPMNRNPEPDEIAQCLPYLKEQIALVKPQLIVALGTFAAQALLGTQEKISKLRGKLYFKDTIKVIPTFHPSYLLRNPDEKKWVWSDLQMAMQELGLKSGPGA